MKYCHSVRILKDSLRDVEIIKPLLYEEELKERQNLVTLIELLSDEMSDGKRLVLFRKLKLSPDYPIEVLVDILHKEREKRWEGKQERFEVISDFEASLKFLKNFQKD